MTASIPIPIHTYIHTYTQFFSHLVIALGTYINYIHTYIPMYDEAKGNALLSWNSFRVKAWKENLMKETYGAHEPSQLGNLGMYTINPVI